MRLRRSDPSEPGITRVRHGRGFTYRNGSRAVGKGETLDRIHALAIPPAWKEVWICVAANGHIQAVGTDEAGRRQYLYHEKWRTSQDAVKHDRALGLARVLPKARRKVTAHLRHTSMDRERALAVAFRLLDLGSFRIGSEAYASSNGTYGLATLKRKQVDVDADELHLDFPGKGAKEVDWLTKDKALARAADELLERKDRNPELLAWHDDDSWHDVKSTDVNDYVREMTGGDFTAKDFRTWNATVLMAVELATAELPESATARQRVVRECVKHVAEHLNNTPAVARKSYIDPRVIDLYLDGTTLAASALPAAGTVSSRGRTKLESAVRRLLED